jgi:hypothetical protein
MKTSINNRIEFEEKTLTSSGSASVFDVFQNMELTNRAGFISFYKTAKIYKEKLNDHKNLNKEYYKQLLDQCSSIHPFIYSSEPCSNETLGAELRKLDCLCRGIKTAPKIPVISLQWFSGFKSLGLNHIQQQSDLAQRQIFDHSLSLAQMQQNSVDRLRVLQELEADLNSLQVEIEGIKCTIQITLLWAKKLLDAPLSTSILTPAPGLGSSAALFPEAKVQKSYTKAIKSNSVSLAAS